MADVTITYAGNEIAAMSDTGTKTLETQGKYCTDDITVAYTKPTPAAGSATTPATTITANPSISVSNSGLITATASASKSITPTVVAGYVSAGTAGTVTVSGSNTQQLTTKAAATYTPTTSAQTIASGQYLTGAQTISGDPNLLAENIKDGVSIFSVTGNYQGGGGGGGSYTVSVSLGNPRSPGSFVSCTIYDATFTGGSLTKGSQLGAITSPTGSTSVTVSAPANALWIDLVGGYINWSPYDSIYSAGGGTALMPHNSTIFNGGSSVYGVYVVIDNGNISMDWIDWDD